MNFHSNKETCLIYLILSHILIYMRSLASVFFLIIFVHRVNSHFFDQIFFIYNSHLVVTITLKGNNISKGNFRAHRFEKQIQDFLLLWN